MKRVVVTGGSGFVGANLVRRLLRDGHEVHLLLRPGHLTWRLDEIAASVRSLCVDVQDRNGVRRVIADVRPDWVFHMAAYGAYSTQTGFERMLGVNVTGCANVLDACAEVGVEAFVQTGSSSEYGYRDHPAAEAERLDPNSYYAITKAAATHYCQLTARHGGLHATTARLYSVYGPYEEPTRLIPTLLVRGFESKLPPLVSPRTARDFIYVDDAVDALVVLASNPSLPRGSVFNICTGTQTTLESVVAGVRRILHVAAEPVWSSMPPRTWDTDVWVGSPEALRRGTGWSAATTIETGLERTAGWFRHKPEWLAFYARKIESRNP